MFSWQDRYIRLSALKSIFHKILKTKGAILYMSWHSNQYDDETLGHWNSLCIDTCTSNWKPMYDIQNHSTYKNPQCSL